jgi:hypothetical protein
MYECLDKTDGDKLRAILNSAVDLSEKEHRLVCTFRLPKGKRPSRVREDVKVERKANNFFFILNTYNLDDYNGWPFLFVS